MATPRSAGPTPTTLRNVAIGGAVLLVGAIGARFRRTEAPPPAPASPLGAPTPPAAVAAPAPAAPSPAPAVDAGPPAPVDPAEGLAAAAERLRAGDAAGAAGRLRAIAPATLAGLTGHPPAFSDRTCRDVARLNGASHPGVGVEREQLVGEIVDWPVIVQSGVNGRDVNVFFACRPVPRGRTGPMSFILPRGTPFPPRGDFRLLGALRVDTYGTLVVTPAVVLDPAGALVVAGAATSRF